MHLNASQPQGPGLSLFQQKSEFIATRWSCTGLWFGRVEGSNPITAETQQNFKMAQLQNRQTIKASSKTLARQLG